MRALLPGLAVTCLVLLAACSDDAGGIYFGVDRGDASTATDATDASSDVSQDVGTDPGVDGPATLPDASTDTATTDTPESDTPTGDEITGGVTVFEVRSPAVSDLETGGVGAGFRIGAAAAGPPIATVGGCEIRDTSEAGELFETGPSLDAGDIEVTVGGSAYVLTHDGERYGSSAPDGQIEYFSGGDTITASATGAAVPAFSGSWTAPVEPVVTSPSWSLGDEHDRDDDLRVTWDGAPATTVVVNILPVDVFPEPGIGEGNSVTCTVADTGSFTIPAAALAYLPEGGGFGGGTVALTVARLSNAEIRVGNATLTMNASASHTVVGAIP